MSENTHALIKIFSSKELEMIQIKTGVTNVEDLSVLLKWLNELWPPFVSFDAEKKGLILPQPILAYENDKVVGGLAFTGYEKPQQDDIGLWINAVYVHEKWRGLKIASKLIRTAEIVATQYGHECLYAQTDVPHLYLNNGWKIVSENQGNTVLSKSL